MRQEPNMKVAEGAGLTMDNIDFEFMTRGDPIVQAKDTAGRFQQNLTPEEINEMAELAPYAEKFMILTIKGETGKMPSQEDVDQLLQQTTQEMGSTNEQGMAIEQGSGAMVPQDMQTKRKVPSRPVEDKMLENAVPPTDNAAPIDRMMSGGGKVVDISDILEGDKPDWLIRALDPSTEMTKNNESIRSLTGSMDGRQILIPSIRMVDGELVRYKPEEAFRIAREKQDYLVIPAKSDEEAEAYSKELSNEISRRRGMQMGGVAAGPIGVVDKPGADNSGVADDVPAESDGFIINAAAVRHAGLRDINDMIQDAKKYAEKQGMKLNFGKTPTDAEQILVSNGEVVIPDVIANIIGYDRLEKINNRGKKETEEKIANQEQQQPAQPVMQAAEGGEVFPAEDAMVRQETLKTLTPFLDEQMLNNVGIDKIKEIYSLYWNQETKAKTQGGNRRDYNNPKGVWMTHLQDSTEHELQPGIPEAIREIMPAFDSELKSLKIYDPELFEYFAKIESKGGKDLINKKSKDYGAFQINMNNVSKYFNGGFFSPYMSCALQATQEFRNIYPGVVHLDGTSRLQVVTEEPHKTLLQVWKKVS